MLTVLHLGAGFHSPTNEEALVSLSESALKHCSVHLASPIQCVTDVIRVLEDSDLTNAGYGSYLTSQGKVECDAVMGFRFRGAPNNKGHAAVTNSTEFRNPIKFVQLLLQHRFPALQTDNSPSAPFNTPSSGSLLAKALQFPSSMTGVGALAFLNKHASNNEREAVHLVSNLDLISQAAKRSMRKMLRKQEKLRSSLSDSPMSPTSPPADTVGAATFVFPSKFDDAPCIAVGASSGGPCMRLPGRVGPAAIYGAAAFTDWRYGAKDGENEEGRRLYTATVLASGIGEILLQTSCARKACGKLLDWLVAMETEESGAEEEVGDGDDALEDDVLSSCLREMLTDDVGLTDESDWTRLPLGVLAVTSTQTLGRSDTLAVTLAFAHTSPSFGVAFKHSGSKRNHVLINRKLESQVIATALFPIKL